MRLYEYQGKEILHQHALKVPRSAVISKYEEADRILQVWKRVDRFFVKPQLLQGKRGKLGLIKDVDRDELKQTCKSLLKKTIHGLHISSLLIEKKQYIREENYLSITIDRENKNYVLLYSGSGGVDVEEQKQRVKRISFNEFDDRQMKHIIRDREILEIARVLFSIMKKYDALLIEINPLAKTVNGFVAIDCKMIIDDNALYRQESFKNLNQDKGTMLEQAAKKKGIHYVELGGDIGVIGNGAGLVMAAVDMIHHYGGTAANFLDVRGGTGSQAMFDAMKIVMAGEPRALLISIFGGITHCDNIAQGFLEYKNQFGLHIPAAIKITGTNEEQAKQLLEQEGIDVFPSVDSAVKKLISGLKK